MVWARNDHLGKVTSEQLESLEKGGKGFFVLQYVMGKMANQLAADGPPPPPPPFDLVDSTRATSSGVLPFSMQYHRSVLAFVDIFSANGVKAY